MQFIYVLQLTPQFTQQKNWTDETNRIVGEHFNYLKTNFERGIVRFVGKTDYAIDHPDNRGISVFEAEDIAAANIFMQNDPCVINGVMTATVHPFRVVFN